jgi:hypothetical protein
VCTGSLGYSNTVNPLPLLFCTASRVVLVPRPGWERQPEGSRLTDHLSIGVLTRTFGRDLIDSILVATDKVQRRIRLLPSRVMIYFMLAFSLYPQDSYEEVMRHLSEADQFSSSWSVPSKVAIFKARLRVGAEPMRRLYETVVKPLATPGDEGAFYRGLRLVAIDGTSLSVADSAENLAHIARPTTPLCQGESRRSLRVWYSRYLRRRCRPL